MLTLLRMIFIDCAVPILFLILTAAIATTLSTFMAIILSGEKLEGIVKIRASHLTAVVTGNGPLLLHPLSGFTNQTVFPLATINYCCHRHRILLLAINVLAQIGKLMSASSFP